MIAGLTGGIGSGKSTVARIFSVLGCAVFSSDEAARQAYFRKDVKENIIRLLGPEAYADDLTINRSYISSRLFSDADLLKSVNAVIHPAVGDIFREFVAERPGQLIIKESALLFEAGVTAGLDKIIVVTANDELRAARVMKRDRVSREEVNHRMRNQLPQEQKVKEAHYVILNDETVLLIPQVERIFNLLNAA